MYMCVCICVYVYILVVETHSINPVHSTLLFQVPNARALYERAMEELPESERSERVGG